MEEIMAAPLVGALVYQHLKKAVANAAARACADLPAR